MKNLSPIQDFLSDSGGNTPSVLIISKEKESRSLFSEILKMWDYRVFETEKSEDLSTDGGYENFDAILMEMDFEFGIELVNFCRLKGNKNFCNTPIIIVSSHSHPKCRSVAFAIGANEYLVKPIDYDRLENLLNKLTGNQALKPV